MSNKIETPLQRLIAELNKSKSNLDGNCKESKTEIETLECVILKAESLLPYEREVIENFGSKMQIISDVDFDGNVTFALDPKESFNQTFQTNENEN